MPHSVTAFHFDQQPLISKILIRGAMPYPLQGKVLTDAQEYQFKKPGWSSKIHYGKGGHQQQQLFFSLPGSHPSMVWLHFINQEQTWTKWPSALQYNNFIPATNLETHMHSKMLLSVLTVPFVQATYISSTCLICLSNYVSAWHLCT